MRSAGTLFGCLVLATTLQASPSDWPCEWFNWGCDEGVNNGAFIDFGRERTVESFLFFDADSAVLKRSIEIEFSKRSAAMGDYLELQWRGEGLPEGSQVTLNGSRVAPPHWVRVVAATAPWTGELEIRIPPTGEDHVFHGNLITRSHGFERAGTQELTATSQEVPMVKVQGDVDSDWHWLKRLLFWLVVITVTAVSIWKWVFAPSIYKRFKTPRLVVSGFTGGDFSTPALTMPYGGLNRRILSRRGVKLLVLSNKRVRQSPLKSFLNGKDRHCPNWAILEGVQVQVMQGATRRRNSKKGWKMQVLWHENGRERTKNIYRHHSPQENQLNITTPSGKAVALRFEMA